MNRSRSALFGAFGTMITLFGGLAFGFALGNLVFNALPGHSQDPLRIGTAMFTTMVGMAVGGALWGILIGKLAGRPLQRRMAWTGALGFGPITILMALVLLLVEPIAVERIGGQIPIHRLFTILFVPSAFIIAWVGSFALGVGLGSPPAGRRMAWRVGLMAAATFLVVNLIMDALGWRVGGPNAAERFTMLTVMFTGDLAAAVAGGAVIGWMAPGWDRPSA